MNSMSSWEIIPELETRSVAAPVMNFLHLAPKGQMNIMKVLSFAASRFENFSVFNHSGSPDFKSA